MFIQKFLNDVTINDCVTNTGKKMMCVTKPTGGKQFFNIDADNIIEGQTAYFYANKLILAVCFDNINDEDKKNFFHSQIKIRFGKMSKKTTLMYCKFGDYRWGDVFVLPGIHPSMNDPERLIDEVIIVFCDRAEGIIIGARSFPIDGEIAQTLSYFDFLSFEEFSNSAYAARPYRNMAELRSAWFEFDKKDIIYMRTIDIENSHSLPGMYGMDLDETDFAGFFKF